MSDQALEILAKNLKYLAGDTRDQAQKRQEKADYEARIKEVEDKIGAGYVDSYKLCFLAPSRYLSTDNRLGSLFTLFFFNLKFRLKRFKIEKDLEKKSLDKIRMSDNPKSADYHIIRVNIWNPEIAGFEERLVSSPEAPYFLILERLIVEFRNNIETLNQYGQGIQFDNPESFLSVNFEFAKVLDFVFGALIGLGLIYYPYLSRAGVDFSYIESILNDIAIGYRQLLK